eukprot:TRINITY_DN686_c0_g1_i1.p1 TRINITY_DN686_c0_g1~~TRINITY_DN686_c0_g1_i1.p1  ORF type:complete len:603 (-),score=134.60 TRINITY_DN686_c0_g1_i1:128-1936(-)
MQTDLKNDSAWSGEPSIKRSELELGPKIATGSFGTVHKGTCRGVAVAIKVLHDQHLSKEKIDELRKEVVIMTRLKHPYILMSMGVCTDPGQVALVMEYVDGRNLDTILKDTTFPLTLQRQIHIAKGIAKGMNWLHCLDPPIIHRDIKPANVLVNAAFDVKVCDFGLSCVKEIPKPGEGLRDTAVGSPIWMSPEVLSGHLASEKSDIYAFAIVMWQILTRETPFKGIRSFDEFLDEIIDNHTRPPIPKGLDSSFEALINDCWHPEPAKRPSFGQILDRLDDVLINVAIKDEKGRKIWHQMRSKVDMLRELYPFSVAWPYFAQQMKATVAPKLDEVSFLLLPGVRCMQIILAEDMRDLTTQKGLKKVSCDNFGKFVDTFGPLNSSFLDRLQTLCEKPWFHGAISTGEAENRLKTGGGSDKRGIFLVRLSSNPQSSFTISRFNKGGVIVHQRIMRDRATGQFLIQIDDKLRTYATLIDLVDGLKGDMFLQTPCSDSRDFAIVFMPTYESGGYLAAEAMQSVLNAVQTTTSPSNNGSSAGGGVGHSGGGGGGGSAEEAPLSARKTKKKSTGKKKSRKEGKEGKEKKERKVHKKKKVKSSATTGDSK